MDEKGVAKDFPIICVGGSAGGLDATGTIVYGVIAGNYRKAAFSLPHNSCTRKGNNKIIFSHLQKRLCDCSLFPVEALHANRCCQNSCDSILS